MFAFRSSTSASVVLRRGIVKLQSPSISTSDVVFRAFSSEASDVASGDFQTGVVKFYLRNKAYGFIISDKDPLKELWVHRTGLDTPHNVEEFPTRPYLLKGESVMFRVESGENGRQEKAVDVRFKNGRQVPLYRKNYHASVVRGEMQRLGETVFEILKQNMTAEEYLGQIKAAVNAAETEISLAAEKQEHFGPEPDKE